MARSRNFGANMKGRMPAGSGRRTGGAPGYKVGVTGSGIGRVKTATARSTYKSRVAKAGEG